MKNSIYLESITVLLTILFLYTGISKLIDHSLFKEQLLKSLILAPFAKAIAISLPFVEFLVVLLLMVPRWRLKGLFISLLLMTVFTFYIIAIVLFNKELPCSCGGVLEQLSWRQHIIFNICFLAFAVIGFVLEKKVKKQNKSEVSMLYSSQL